MKTEITIDFDGFDEDHDLFADPANQARFFDLSDDYSKAVITHKSRILHAVLNEAAANPESYEDCSTTSTASPAPYTILDPSSIPAAPRNAGPEAYAVYDEWIETHWGPAAHEVVLYRDYFLAPGEPFTVVGTWDSFEVSGAAGLGAKNTQDQGEEIVVLFC
jgi:hypothetical protein